MTEKQAFELPPGEEFTICCGRAAVRFTVELPDGFRISGDLGPGQGITIRKGADDPSITLDPPERGLGHLSAVEDEG